MPGNSSIQTLIDHTEAMITVLEDLYKSTAKEISEEQSRPAPDPQFLAFLQDIQKRSNNLSSLLEEDVIHHLIGINNLLGPIEHLRSLRNNE